VHGIDPHDAKERQAREAMTYNDVWLEWLNNPRRKRTLRRRSSLDMYGGLHRLHIEPAIGRRPIKSLDKQTINKAIEKIRRDTTDEERGRRSC
jgi:hypothetical protein